MIPEVRVFAQVAAIVVLLVGSLSAIAVITFRAVKRSEAPRTVGRDTDLAHLQRSVDAIAVEVERIAEAQRFSAKLLAERGDARDVVKTPGAREDLRA